MRKTSDNHQIVSIQRSCLLHAVYMYLEQSQYMEALRLITPNNDDLIQGTNKYAAFLAEQGFEDSAQSGKHYMRMAKGALSAMDFANCKKFIDQIKTEGERSMKIKV